MDIWDPRFAEGTPVLSVLRDTARQIAGGSWPDVASLQRALERAEVCTAAGVPLRLARGAATGGAPYEIRLYTRGELEFRERNWHDLFNVLVWLTFPRAKAALNARHYAAFAQVSHPAGGRGTVRDALTLFDEEGIVVLSAEPALLQLIRDFRWKHLFWARRADVLAGMCFLPFGHALCEKALAPYQGMTGRGLLLEVDAAFLQSPVAEQVATVDRQVARQLADTGVLQRTRELAPVPVLGIPGWHAGNANPDYYDDSQYFRPGRMRSMPSGIAVRGRG